MLPAVFLAMGVTAAASAGAAAATLPFGVTMQGETRAPRAWRALSTNEQAQFDLGYLVFNTEWSPAGSPAGKTDGLGPRFNGQGCDACHNSRRRGRGPQKAGDAPQDLVVQLGERQADGTVTRGTREYGRALNTAAIQGFTPEAHVTIEYSTEPRTLADGTRIELSRPHYRVSELIGAPLEGNTVLMPRLAPAVQGAGLLDQVPASALESMERAERGSVRGRVSRLHLAIAPSPGTHPGEVTTSGIGRFGWQATEPSVAAQTARALGVEMGLTSPLIDAIDCGERDAACRAALAGGTPEVESELFAALLFFEEVGAVTVRNDDIASNERALHAKGSGLFVSTGCAECHRMTLPVQIAAAGTREIHPYTDLLLHDLGDGLADRDVGDQPVHSAWRTAPLWGIGSAPVPGHPSRYLHDGRARSIEEAILWHGGDASGAVARYGALVRDERRVLLQWVGSL